MDVSLVHMSSTDAGSRSTASCAQSSDQAQSHTITRADGLGGTTRLSLECEESFGRQEEALAKMFGEIAGYLRTGERPQGGASFHEGAEVLRVIDALVNSSERGQWVKLDSAS